MTTVPTSTQILYAVNCIKLSIPQVLYTNRDFTYEIYKRTYKYTSTNSILEKQYIIKNKKNKIVAEFDYCDTLSYINRLLYDYNFNLHIEDKSILL